MSLSVLMHLGILTPGSPVPLSQAYNEHATMAMEKSTNGVRRATC